MARFLTLTRLAAFAAVCAFALAMSLSCRSTLQTSSGTQTSAVALEKDPRATSNTISTVIHTEIGFRTRRNLDEHYQKHGEEFDGVTKQEYLKAAQTLRDAKVGGEILEARRPDGTVSRFDKRTGAFIAFDADLTIRTFFKPNDGERYFQRQINRDH